MESLEKFQKVFFHEALRQYGDLILMKHDLAWLVKELSVICRKHFKDWLGTLKDKQKV